MITGIKDRLFTKMWSKKKKKKVLGKMKEFIKAGLHPKKAYI